MKYTIVKYARSKWKHYYVDDPKRGVLSCHSAHDTPTGMDVAIKQTYFDFYAAARDCAIMNNSNSMGDYAVCPVIE